MCYSFGPGEISLDYRGREKFRAIFTIARGEEL